MVNGQIKVYTHTGIITCFILVLLAMTQNVYGQKTVVKGYVTDAVTNKPIGNVVVFYSGTNVGTYTDSSGYYILQTDQPVTSMFFSYIGYKTLTHNITGGAEQILNVALENNAKKINSVVIKAGGRLHYHNKHNPAVDLIREVIDNKSKNQPEAHDYVQYGQYEKIQMAMSNTPSKLRHNLLLKKYKFITDAIDTTKIPGRGLLTFYQQEVLSECYYRKNPEKKKTIIEADKKVDFKEYIDNKGFYQFIKHFYQDINIYSNNISVITNEFLSPIANTAPTFYRFYVSDTVVLNGQCLAELSFFPRNKEDMLFQGKIYVTLDGTFAVAKVVMMVNPEVNLNWVSDINITQSFGRQADGRYYVTKSEMSADFKVTPGTTGGIYVDRSVSSKDYVIDQPKADTFYSGEPVVTLSTIDKHDNAYWKTNRPDSLNASEAQAYTNMDSVQKTPTYKHVAELASVLTAGYKKVGRKFELGPVNSIYSFDPLQGSRIKLGGRTTPFLSKDIYFDGYGAYGFTDQQWKYTAGVTYSFTHRSIYEFPVKDVRVSYKRDVDIPGQNLQFVQEDNFLLSFKRGVDNKFLYGTTFNVDVLNEFKNHFSYEVSFKNWRQQAADSLRYTTVGDAYATEKTLNTSEIMLQLRWAPKEQFYQGKVYRTQIPNKYPIFILRTIVGVQGILGSQYNYQNIVLNIYKHVYLSQLGFTDIVLEGGYVFGKLPYPLLYIAPANQTYSLQFNSYNLMNFLEFVSDHYVSLNIDHCFNGFIFNKIPLFKKLRFREYIGGKVLYGSLRNENLPTANSGLLQFPTENGAPSTFTLRDAPYVEGSVGVGNIFKFVRVDLVRRFTYLGNPNVSPLGLRLSLKFDF